LDLDENRNKTDLDKETIHQNLTHVNKKAGIFKFRYFMNIYSFYLLFYRVYSHKKTGKASIKDK
jgi:hypothetical protein